MEWQPQRAERLDPALSRPGRMDVWVNFTHATKWQAEGIFKCFFPCKPAGNITAPDAAPADASQKNLPLPKRKAPAHVIPLLSEEEISELAKRFAAAIPEDELSVAGLQGYLLKNKTRPRECVDEVGEWIVQERETREKLKKEKAEVSQRFLVLFSGSHHRTQREAKEKKEAEEKEKKEKDEKEAKEKEEKEIKEKLERKEARAKAKKQLAKEAAAKEVAAKEVAKISSSTITTPSTPTETSAAEETTTTESSASSESEGTGVDADTEESLTSDDDTEKPGENKEEAAKEAKEKWVAVKGTSDTSTTTPAADAGP
ncbi:hypothetical protein C0992_005541 [Termitomyces sp. T32_za158]|nr:hypothetical protein C0992_005541 [Termitomyces sp. T32_za158]